ncbi:MAG: type II secretion system protein [Phycisphaerales bacterium]|nr:type II secretion system GspH family protein [Phycisphaerae bacterium]NNF43040.1 type II secretion system protein [Phycisphaerales bacterium]NNM27022.1 type II secretion system protein [Phycisphaerales bacterium]
MTDSRRHAFTLIELLAVIVVLAILAGVALPKYFDYSSQAKEAACKGALGGLRAGIANYYANGSLTGSALYPTTAQLTAAGTVLQEALPENPYNSLNTVDETTTALDATNRTTDGTTGWRYYVDNAVTPTTVEIWANSDVDDGTVDEHLF